uniref:Chemosensory protein 2 n=1 Tax=Delia antiqua TaxID=265456 RepID=D4AHP0_9MUSC|nr:chemosensory protein 2 [Delia antiqua]
MFRLIWISLFISYLTFIQAVPHPPATTAAPLKQTYDNKFDNIDIDEILGQERLLKNYVKCLEGLGPCTPDGKMLKDIPILETLPDAMATNCAKCTERQKYGSDRVTHFLIDNRPEDWDRLEKIYNPEGSYKKAYLMEKQKLQPTNEDGDAKKD